VAVCWGMWQLNAVWWHYLLLWLVMFLAGIPLCTRAASLRQRKDPGSVVWDEMTAFPLMFVVVSVSWPALAMSFLFFRLFDILKPWPVRRFERLPGGLGIMADDQIAAVYAGAILWVVTRAL
jgi:phosphatidylglycerophosphatase A